jgi:hypothetical protein
VGLSHCKADSGKGREAEVTVKGRILANQLINHFI